MKLLFKRNLPFLWAILCVTGCVDVTGSEGSGPTPHALTFSHDVAPIFAQSCVFCHHLGNATAIDFTHPFDPAMGIIRRAKWITDGAKDDAFYQENIATLFGDGKSLGTQGGKCGYCHYENTYQLPDLTHPFDPNVGIVDVAGSTDPGARFDAVS